MSRKRRGDSTEVEITLDRKFLVGFLGVLALVLALGLGVLVGQLGGNGTTSPAAQPAAQSQLQQQPVVQPQQSGQQPAPQVQSDGSVQVQPQSVAPSGSQGDVLTEQDATGLVAGDVMQSPCFIVNLLEFEKNTVKSDYRVTKVAQTEEPHPELEIEGLNAYCGNAYDFGLLGPTEVGQQTFALKNVGEEPLTVSGLYTSCGCTVAQVEGHELGAEGVLSPPVVLEPGESKEFLIALDAKQVGDSRQPRIVQVFTDDPRGVPFGEQWPVQGKDNELRFAIVAQVDTTGGGGQ